MRCGREIPEQKSQLTLIANLLGAVSGKLDFVGCGGVSVDVLMTPDKMPASEVLLQYLYVIHQLQLEKFLRKPSYSVMGRIDKLAPLTSFLPQMVGWLDTSGYKILAVCVHIVKFLAKIWVEMWIGC